MEGHTNHKMTCLIVLFNFRGPTVTQSITGRVRYKNHASMFLITPTPHVSPQHGLHGLFLNGLFLKVPTTCSYCMFLLHVPMQHVHGTAAWLVHSVAWHVPSSYTAAWNVLETHESQTTFKFIAASLL